MNYYVSGGTPNPTLTGEYYEQCSNIQYQQQDNMFSTYCHLQVSNATANAAAAESITLVLVTKAYILQKVSTVNFNDTHEVATVA